MNHAIKIENLYIKETTADLMINTFKDILLELGFNDDRINPIECRSRDGFIPHSHNHGGINGVCFTSNSGLRGGGYDYGDGIIQKWDDIINKMYHDDHPGKLRFLNQFWARKRKTSALMDRVLDHYYEYIDGDSDYDSTMFEVRFMVLEDGSVNVGVFGCTSDAPYFRGSDYNKSENFKFGSSDRFKADVLKFLETCDCIDLISECY